MLLQECDRVLLIIDLDIEGAVGVIPLLLSFNVTLEPAICVEALALWDIRACLLELLNRSFLDALDVCASRILALLLS